MRLDIYHHSDSGDLAHSEILCVLKRLEQKLETIVAHLDELTAKVSEVGTVMDSAIALIEGISAKLKEAGTDPVKLTALVADLDAKSDALAAAVLANTPAEPE